MKLEAEINKALKTTPATKVHVAFLATSRDELLPALVEGRGDIVAANVTVTPERAKLVDFTVPGKTGVREIIVTGPGAAVLNSLDDLGGKQIHVREQEHSVRESDRAEREPQAEGQGPGRHQDGPARRSKTRTSSRWSTPDC